MCETVLPILLTFSANCFEGQGTRPRLSCDPGALVASWCLALSCTLLQGRFVASCTLDSIVKPGWKLGVMMVMMMIVTTAWHVRCS